jgi:disulfide bond formation protein DsbB
MGALLHSRPWLPISAVLLLSLLALAAVFALQYGAGLAPCSLCLYQRWPYYAALFLGTAALLALGLGAVLLWVRLAMALAGLGFLLGAGVAVYHLGIEQHWWSGPGTCTGTAAGLGAASIAELRAALEAAPVVRCDVVAWSLFGVSLAGYNVLATLALAGLSFIAAAAAGERSGRVHAS